uniref:Uncharacterized protein n=1 Tax=uncultured bacterium A1Q1_fos_2140 TaxID=1256565 RepID=L7W0A0_9BACT|nr:hypothetical protein [uncultured bacterium A1Q1_fos_2140]
MFVKFMKHKGYADVLFTKPGLKRFLEKHIPDWTAWVKRMDALEEEEAKGGFLEPEAAEAKKIAIDWTMAVCSGEEMLFLNDDQERVVRLPMQGRVLILGPAGSGKTSSIVQWLGENSAEGEILYLTDSPLLLKSVRKECESMGCDLEKIHFKTFNNLLEENIPDCKIVGQAHFDAWLKGYLEGNNPEALAGKALLKKRSQEDIRTEIRQIAGLDWSTYEKRGVLECRFHDPADKAWLFRACADYQKQLYPQYRKPAIGIWLREYLKTDNGIAVSKHFLKKNLQIQKACETLISGGLTMPAALDFPFSDLEKQWIFKACSNWRENCVHPAFYDPALQAKLAGRYTAMIFDEAQKCNLHQLNLATALAESAGFYLLDTNQCTDANANSNLHQLNLATALAESAGFYLLDTNQCTDANANIKETLRKQLLARFPHSFQEIELLPCCYRSHPLILDCLVNPLLKAKGILCGLDYKGKYSWVSGVTAEDSQNVFSRIEKLDDNSRKTLQKMTASCEFAVLAATEAARNEAIALFGETAVWRTTETAGLEFDQVLLHDCLNQPGLQETAKCLRELQVKGMTFTDIRQFHRATADMEGREAINGYFRNLYLAASRAKKGLQIYQSPGRDTDTVLAFLQELGMPKETTPVFEKLEASTPEAWQRLMERLILDHKIERAWSVYQQQCSKNRKDFEFFCEACQEKAEAPTKPPLAADKPLKACGEKNTTSLEIPAAEKPLRLQGANFQAIETCLDIPVSFADQGARNDFWKQKITLHFPYRKLNNSPDMERQFREIHDREYQGLSPETGRLFSMVKENSHGAFLTANPAKALHEKDERGWTLIDWIQQKNNAVALLRHCYESANQDINSSNVSRNIKTAERLHMAVICGQFEEVKRNIGKNMANSIRYGESPLYLAARYGYFRIAEYLINNAGAKINTQQENGSKESALHIAVAKNRPDIVRLLLSKGADIRLDNSQGKTPGVLAKEIGDQKLIALFKESSDKKTANRPIQKTVNSSSKLYQLIASLREKKINLESFKDNKTLIQYLKKNNLLPNAKMLNNPFLYEQIGWLTLILALPLHCFNGERLLLALLEAGIEADAKALNTFCTEKNINCWWLFANNRWTALMTELLNRNILPDCNALNTCSTYNAGVNAWELLISQDANFPVLRKLLEKNILPTALLNRELPCDLDSENYNIWSRLLSNNETKPVFKTLLEKGIFPHTEDLSVCNSFDNTNIWHQLASGKQDLASIMALLERNILPKAQDLDVCSKFGGRNFWYLISMSDEGIPVLIKLLEKNILPSAKALNNRGDAGFNVWSSLAIGKERLSGLMALLKKGIFPDASDLNDKITDSTAWYWILKYDEGTIVLKLFEKNILPTPEAMAEFAWVNWYRLANNPQLRPVFLALLDRNILPPPQIFSNCIAKLKNFWWELILKGQHSLFLALLEKNILPRLEDLSGISNTTKLNFWLFLAQDNKNIPILNALLEKNILPDREAANFCDPQNRNLWWCLSNSSVNTPVFMTLLKKNVLPCLEDLNVCSRTDNTNAWPGLSGLNANVPVFMALMEKNILPRAQDLAVPCSITHCNSWHWLAGSADRTPLIVSLLERGILPNPKDLAICHKTQGKNVWFLLATDSNKTPAFMALLERGILPDTKDLAACSSVDNSHAWYFLAGCDKRIALFQSLLERNILPDDEVLNSAVNTIRPTKRNIWCLLAASDAGIPILEFLLDSGRVPRNKITLKTMIHLFESRQRDLIHPVTNRLHQLLADFRESAPESLPKLGIFTFPERDEARAQRTESRVFDPGNCIK